MSSEADRLAAGFYRALCQYAGVAIVAADLDYRIVSWNDAASRILGATADEMVGRPVFDMVPEDRRGLFRKLLERTSRQKAVTEFQITHKTSAGETHELAVVLSPVVDSEGIVIGLSAWIRDITKRTHLEKQLAHAEKMASLGTLAGGVAHHFNNILGGVATSVDFALRSNDPAALRRALQTTARAVERVSQLTQSLLTFAESSHRDTDLADLTEVVLTFVDLAEKPLAEKNIKICLELEPVPVIEVPAARVHQVLGNLLANAEDAMPDGGEIRLAMATDGGHVILRFSDTGKGVPADVLPHIFDPFFTTKGAAGGGDRINPGLGLAVVHGILAELGVAVTAESLPGQGTTIALRFQVRS